MKPHPLLLLALSSSLSGAAILVNYDFNNDPDRTTATSAHPLLTAGLFSSHSSIGLPARPVIYPGWAAAPTSEVVGTGGAPGTEAAAITGNDYFSFTLTPTAGHALNLTALNFSTTFYTVTGSVASLSGGFFVRTSVDNFATTIGGIFSETHVVTASPEFTSRQVLFSGAQYQNLTAPVTVRIYLYDNSNSEFRHLAIDDVLLSGDVVTVPESATAALALVSCLPFLRRRR